VELRLNSQISAQVCTGYELDVSVDNAQAYFAIDRWNGPLGSFTLLAVNYNVPVVKNGDVVSATITSTGVITGYLNGVAEVTATDTMFPFGNPGIGFFASGSSVVDSTYGWSSFSATDGASINPTPTAAPTPTPVPTASPTTRRHHRG
jgi:hypothetical protein